MSNKMKKIILVAVALVLIVVVIVGVRKSTQNSDIIINTSLNQKDSVVYSDSSNTNTFYFIVEIDGVSVDDLIPEFTFDNDVSYEVFYENIKDRSSLPIEYYLSAETDFNFDDMDKFNDYASDRKVLEEYEENEVYEGYIKDYKNNSDYRQYKSGFGIYMFELKVSNASNDTVLKNVKFSTEDENANRTIVYDQNTNVKYVKSSSSNNMYTTFFDEYEHGKYYDGNTKFDFEIKCNQDINLSEYKTKVQGYDLTDINVYKDGVLMESPSCVINETVNVEIAIKTDKNKSFNNSIAIDFTNKDSSVTIYTPQIFSPENILFLGETNLDKYSRYFEYKYNLR